jgi:hypothetical protein
MGVSGQHHAPAVLYPGEGTPGTHCTGGWVGPRAGLDAEARGKILCLCRGSNPGHPVHSHTILTELPQLLHFILYILFTELLLILIVLRVFLKT